MITIVFASYNGARNLPRMLDALHSLEDPGERWNIIAVDNASTDNTRAILETYSRTLPITILSAPERGKNKSLNKAIPYLYSDLVILTDDDVIPKPDWLVQFRNTATHLCNYDIFGGQIDLRWPFTPPDYILNEVDLGPTFASTDHINNGPCRPGDVYGGNMCVRTLLFTRYGFAFNEDIGPAAGNYVMGSETDLVTRAAAEGYHCWHTKEPVVEHIVKPEQLDPEWLLHRAYRLWRSQGRQQRTTGARNNTPTIYGIPRWRIRWAIEQYIKSIYFKGIGNTQRYFCHKQNFYISLGLMYELSPSSTKRFFEKRPLGSVR